jgi:micrococcal nuclease
MISPPKKREDDGGLSAAKSMLAGALLCFFAIFGHADTVKPLIVIDGDTLRRGGITYRPHGFGAPGTRRSKCAAERELGLKAKARMEQLATGRIEALPQREKYDRTLARL